MDHVKLRLLGPDEVASPHGGTGRCYDCDVCGCRFEWDTAISAGNGWFGSWTDLEEGNREAYTIYCSDACRRSFQKGTTDEHG